MSERNPLDTEHTTEAQPTKGRQAFAEKSIPTTRLDPRVCSRQNTAIDQAAQQQEEDREYETPSLDYHPPGVSSGTPYKAMAKDREKAERAVERTAKQQAAADLFAARRAGAQGHQRDRGDDGRER